MLEPLSNLIVFHLINFCASSFKFHTIEIWHSQLFFYILSSFKNASYRELDYCEKTMNDRSIFLIFISFIH